VKKTLRWVFLGSNGIRAGWRLAIFVGLLVVANFVVKFALNAAHVHPPKPTAFASPMQALPEAVGLLFIVLATWVMSRIERRPMGVYGLPLRGVLRSRVWLGFGWGFAAISLVVLAQWAFHGYAITGLATTGTTLVLALLAWTAGFVLVALVEEYLVRGYAQYTLASGIGFWPAGVVLSLAFAALHLQNGGESATGIINAALFALVMVLALRVTGTLWLAVGIHAGWDWGESFVYNVPDSGISIEHPLLRSSIHGPAWITGGSAGPEATVFTVLALLALGALLWWRFPYPTRTDSERALRPLASVSK
jgi:membrane protease YdiL (CAAX protease family)